MPSIREMRAVCQQRRPNAKGQMVWAGHWFNRLVTRWFSIYISWLCVKASISANAVTVLMILSGLAGIALSIPHLLWLNIAGAVLLLFAHFLDCVDGEVARWTGKSSLKGWYLDLVSHVLCGAPTSIICALHLYTMYRDEKYLILAFAAYAMAQIRLGLRAAYCRVAMHIPQPAGAAGHCGSMPDAARAASFLNRGGMWIKRLLEKSVDEYIVMMATIAAIMLAHSGIELPMIILAWGFAVMGFLASIEHLVRWYASIPDIEHKKRPV